MKRLVLSFMFALAGFAAAAQEEAPTVNWPYLYPDFLEGELRQNGGAVSKGKFNIHLGQGSLNLVEDGLIAEIPSLNILYVMIGDDLFRNVGGKMMKVLAESDKGFVVEETLADYSAVVRDDGAFGGGLGNSAKGFSYDENYGSYGYLVTNVYEDLYSIRNEAEELPVTVKMYLMIDGMPVVAGRKTVSALDGVDKKAFSDFLKKEKIDWKAPLDMLKVIDYVAGL